MPHQPPRPETMILRRSYVLVAFVAALAACGGSDNSASSVCSKGASVVSSLPAKYTPCGDTPSFDFPAPSACEATLAQCTSGDRDALNGVADCLNGLPTCSPDTKSQFESRAAACV